MHGRPVPVLAALLVLVFHQVRVLPRHLANRLIGGQARRGAMPVMAHILIVVLLTALLLLYFAL